MVMEGSETQKCNSILEQTSKTFKCAETLTFAYLTFAIMSTFKYFLTTNPDSDSW